MEMDYPKTRMDNFFAKAAGSDLADNDMEPITDREYWINEMAARIAQGGGGGGGLFVANWNTNTGALDKTAGELIAAYESGKHLVVSAELGEGIEGYVRYDVFEVANTIIEESHYYRFGIYYDNSHEVLRFEANSADEYPLN